MGKRILALTPFMNMEVSSSRPMFICRVLDKIAIVDVVMSDFDHHRKVKIEQTRCDLFNKIISIDTIPYKTNISPLRLISHIVFSIKAAIFFRKNRYKYDIIYVTVPLNLLAALVFLFCKNHKKIIDIIDIWPDALPFPISLKRILFPFLFLWKYALKKAIRSADLLLSVSDSFLKEGLKYYKGDDDNAKRFYIGHRMLPNSSATKEKLPTIIYIGNIGRLYDFKTLLRVMGKKDIKEQFQLFIVGDGDRRLWLLKELKKRQITFKYFGVIYDLQALAELLRRSHIGFNGYIHTTASFSYKANLYLAAGLPILNSMIGDLRDLIIKYELGYNYEPGKYTSLMRCFLDINLEALSKISENCKRFFDEQLEHTNLEKKMLGFFKEKLL